MTENLPSVSGRFKKTKGMFVCKKVNVHPSCILVQKKANEEDINHYSLTCHSMLNDIDINYLPDKVTLEQ